MQTDKEFAKPGVVYCFETIGKKEMTPNGSPAIIYYFGRSALAVARELPAADSEKQLNLINSRFRRDGLNAPRTMLMWHRTDDIFGFWDRLKYCLVWSKHPFGFSWVSDEPKFYHHQDVGDRYFSVLNMDAGMIRQWLTRCCATISKQMQDSP